MSFAEFPPSVRVGVWEQNGRIYRRDFLDKDPFPTIYKALKPELLPRVKGIATALHNTAIMGAWTPEVEAEVARLTEELGKITKS